MSDVPVSEGRPGDGRAWAEALVLGTLILCCTYYCTRPAEASHGDCTFPGRNYPAVTAPECVDGAGHAAECGGPGAIRLWPEGIRPASIIPPHRDSTDRVAGKSVPGAGTGHELFSSVDIVETEGMPRRLYVSYNAGLQVWDIEDDPSAEFDDSDPANPRFLTGRDGWQGHFLSFPPVSEILNFCEDIAAVALVGRDLVGLACIEPVGFSIWRYAVGPMQQLYQDTGTDARQVRIVGEAAYVGTDNGVAVYDLSASESLGGPCLDDQGSACPSVYQGTFAGSGSPFTPRSRRYLDVIYDPADDHVWVATAGGLFSRVELWELTHPANPMSAVLRWTGPLHAQGVALWETGHGRFIAWADESQGLNNERLEIHSLECPNGHCLTAPAIDPLAIGSPTVGTANDFLTYSRGWLYSGVATGQLFGPGAEALLDVSGLRPGVVSVLREVTRHGQSYVDPCNGETVRYWSHLYSENAHGLNNMVPRVGKVSSAGYFYRAAATILDVHRIEPEPGLPFESGFETGDLSEWSQGELSE